MASYYSIIFATVFLSMVASSHQLKCYICIEGDDPKVTKLQSHPFYNKHSVKVLPQPCGDFADKILYDCPEDSSVCMKIDVSKGDKTVSTHDCGNEKICENLEDQAEELEADTVKCHTCSEDQCNSATGLAATFSFLLLVTILTKLH